MINQIEQLIRFGNEGISQFYPDPMLQYHSMISKRRKTANDYVKNVESLVRKCDAPAMSAPDDVYFRDLNIKPKSGVDYIARARRRASREKTEAQKNIGKRRQLQTIDEDELFGGIPIKNFDDIFRSSHKKPKS